MGRRLLTSQDCVRNKKVGQNTACLGWQLINNENETHGTAAANPWSEIGIPLMLGWGLTDEPLRGSMGPGRCRGEVEGEKGVEGVGAIPCLNLADALIGFPV